MQIIRKAYSHKTMIRTIFIIALVIWSAKCATLTSITVSSSPSTVSESAQLLVFGQIQNTIPSNGKISITLPSQTQITQSSSLSCAVNEPSSISVISWVGSGQSVTITIGSQITVSENSSLYFEIVVQGFTNPVSTKKTDSFIFTTLDNSNIEIDQQSSGIQLEATSGVLSDVNITTGSQIAGEFTTATFSITLNHIVPSGGKIVISMPKWNPDAPNDEQQSYINGSFTWTEVQNLNPIDCTFTNDVLTVNSGFSSALPGGNIVSFNVTQFHNPPTTAVRSGFIASTTDTDVSETFQKEH